MTDYADAFDDLDEDDLCDDSDVDFEDPLDIDDGDSFLYMNLDAQAAI